jgi:hypothetical protein
MPLVVSRQKPRDKEDEEGSQDRTLPYFIRKSDGPG